MPGVPETNPGTGGETIPPDGTTVPPEQAVPPVGGDSGVTNPVDPGSVNTGTTENNIDSPGTTTP